MLKQISRLFCILALTIGLTSTALAQIPPIPPIIYIPPGEPTGNPENPQVCIGCATTTAVPLPATLPLIGLGLVALGFSHRKRITS